MEPNKVTFKETIEMFVIDTIPKILYNQEIPIFNILFNREAFNLFNYVMNNPFEIDNFYIPNISKNDISRISNINKLQSDIPAIRIDNPFSFFQYLKDITNSQFRLYQVYGKKLLLRKTLMCILSRIWLRMGPDDFNNVESFLRKQLLFVQNEEFDCYKFETKFSQYYGYDVSIISDINSTWSETTRHISFKIYDSDKSYHSLPNIHYDICEYENEKICYIYALQNAEDRKINKKIERLLYKLNKGVVEHESQEYIDYIKKNDTYYPENISDIHPSSVLAMSLFIELLKRHNITKIRVPVMQILSYDNHIYFSNKSKLEFSKKWSEDRLKNLSKYNQEKYERDKQWYKHVVDKYDIISKNKIENLIRLFRRINYHYPEVDIRNEPMLSGDYLDIRIKNKQKIKN